MTRVVNAIPINKSQIQDDSQFLIKQVEDCKFSIYLEKNIEHLWNRATIDVAGWAAFRRLVLITDEI